MNGFELKILLAILGIFVTTGLLVLSTLTIRYRVTATHLQILWLGLPVRRLQLGDIKRIGSRPVLWAERWPNSWDRGRVLVIRRRTGWLRNLVITPNFPFEFRNTLERARQDWSGESLPTLPTQLATHSSPKAPMTKAA